MNVKHRNAVMRAIKGLNQAERKVRSVLGNVPLADEIAAANKEIATARREAKTAPAK